MVLQRIEWKWFFIGRKTEESADLSFDPIKGRFLKKGNWPKRACFQV